MLALDSAATTVFPATFAEALKSVWSPYSLMGIDQLGPQTTKTYGLLISWTDVSRANTLVNWAGQSGAGGFKYLIVR
jgi:hypothetical protein